MWGVAGSAFGGWRGVLHRSLTYLDAKQETCCVSASFDITLYESRISLKHCSIC